MKAWTYPQEQWNIATTYQTENSPAVLDIPALFLSKSK